VCEGRGDSGAVVRGRPIPTGVAKINKDGGQQRGRKIILDQTWVSYIKRVGLFLRGDSYNFTPLQILRNRLGLVQKSKFSFKSSLAVQFFEVFYKYFSFPGKK
jgi:hypothetical protein